MSNVKTIKGVSENSWGSFKAIAAQSNVKMGKLFEKMVGEYREKSEEFWDDVLKGEKILSDKEAKSMLDTVTKLRKDMGFRR